MERVGALRQPQKGEVVRLRPDPECEDCNDVYVQAFDSQPWKFLWWLDDQLHRHHVHNFLHKWLCDLVDRRLIGHVWNKRSEGTPPATSFDRAAAGLADVKEGRGTYYESSEAFLSALLKRR